jgi:hypothetical protein
VRGGSGHGGSRQGSRAAGDAGGLVEHHHVVETLAAQGPDEAFHVRITLGRPGPFRRLFQVQKSVKPARCQRMTVSGWTMVTASDGSMQTRRTE